MSSPQLSEPDVRAMVRLLVEVSASTGGALEKKKLLMDGLIRLVGGDSWVWAWAPEFHQGKRPAYTAFSYGGFHQERFSKFVLAAQHPESERQEMVCASELVVKRAHLTRSCRQLSFDGTRQGPAAALWAEAGVGEVLFSMRPLDTGGLSTIGIYRPPGAKDFSARETRIAHILLTEIGWLHEAGWSEGSQIETPKLSPRRRMVLDLVLEGRARKDMAQELGISIHTLDGYVKDIFRHFNAHSQAELIARFRSGDGRDTPRSGG